MVNVRRPYEYTAKLPGKSLRSRLIDVFNGWIHANEHDTTVIKSVIETLHNASLMIDDIQDSSTLRRGQKCAYKVFGVSLTINSANLAYFEALKLLQSLDNYSTKLVQSFTEEMINLHEGQGTEIYFRDNDLRPTIEEYYEICSKKTGGLFKLSVKLLIDSIPKAERRFTEEAEGVIISLAEKLGKFYQIRDDYLNIFRGDADDLIEGKFTLPTIFAEIETLKNRKSEDINGIVRKLIDFGADEFCKRTLTEMATEMENILTEIEERTRNSCVKEELKEIIYSLLEE